LREFLKSELKNLKKFNNQFGGLKKTPYLYTSIKNTSKMKKVYASTIFGILLEQKNLLAKYSHDKVATKEIESDIKSIESVVTLLAVRRLLK